MRNILETESVLIYDCRTGFAWVRTPNGKPGPTLGNFLLLHSAAQAAKDLGYDLKYWCDPEIGVPLDMTALNLR